MFVGYIKTKIGIIKIIATDTEIVFVGIVNEIENDTKNNDLILKCESELFEYFNGTRKNFDLPIKIYAKHFETKVLNYLQNVEYGKTISYKELSQSLHIKNGWRVVAKALAQNNIIILLPCHRVVLSNGKVGGYKYGTNVKEYLLNLENNAK